MPGTPLQGGAPQKNALRWPAAYVDETLRCHRPMGLCANSISLRRASLPTTNTTPPATAPPTPTRPGQPHRRPLERRLPTATHSHTENTAWARPIPSTREVVDLPVVVGVSWSSILQSQREGPLAAILLVHR